MTTASEIQKLEAHYAGCRAFHGELHDHASTGGTSDGHCTLTQWAEDLAKLKMDFAAILDHRQVRHMFLPEWKDGLFIGGTEDSHGFDYLKNGVRDLERYGLNIEHIFVGGGEHGNAWVWELEEIFNFFDRYR